MAKSRKKKSAKRPAKARATKKRATKKRVAKAKSRKSVKRTVRRKKAAPQQSFVEAVASAVRETGSLRGQLAGHNTFED